MSYDLKKLKRENKFYARLSNGQIIKLKALNADDALKEAEARFESYNNKCRYMEKYIVFQYKKNKGKDKKKWN